MPRLSSLAVLFIFAATPASAQVPKSLADLADTHAEIVPAKAKPGSTVTYRITVAPKPGAHTYPLKADTGQAYLTRLYLPPPGDLIFVSQPVDPLGFKWDSVPDPGDGFQMHRQTSMPVTWEIKAVVSPNAKPGKIKVKLDKDTNLLVCNANNCIPSKGDGSDLPVASFEVLAGGPVQVERQYDAAVRKVLGPAGPVSPPSPGGTGRDKSDTLGPKPAHSAGAAKDAKPIEQVQAELKSVLDSLDASGVKDTTKDQGLGAFVLTAVIWGLVSLVTPCVFPMIPITVSIFLKHAHGSFRERMKLAGVYCLTIIVVLGLSAFALLKFMAMLSVNPITNVLLGGLFVVLALSLFGMYELTLPNFMVKRLQAKQASGGVVGTIFGALAFTVISFTCVAPFLGGFAGISAAGASGGSLIAMPNDAGDPRRPGLRDRLRGAILHPGARAGTPEVAAEVGRLAR